MTEPLLISFDVACPLDHAFATWTDHMAAWWPADHTVSGQRDVDVVFEAGVGGRIYERTAAGAEHDWGAVTEWQPPTRLAYRWHLGSAAATATSVTVTFTPLGDARTRVDIEHRGWERLGDAAEAMRDRNTAGWDAVLARYRDATTKGA